MKHQLVYGWELETPSERLIVLANESGYVGVTFKEKVFGTAELLLLKLTEDNAKILSTPQFIEEVDISMAKVIKLTLSDFAKQYEAEQQELAMSNNMIELPEHYHHIQRLDDQQPIDFENDQENVKLLDDVYQYIATDFDQLQSTFPDGKLHQGLAEFGVSELDAINTAKFKKMIESRKKEFANRQDPIIFSEDIIPTPAGQETYHNVTDKTKLLEELDKIITLCDEALSAKTGIVIYGL